MYLHVSPDVERHIGAEAVRRLKRRDLAAAGCFDCLQRIGDLDAGVVVLVSPNPVREPDRVLLSHTTCRASGVYPFTASDLAAARARMGISSADLGQSEARIQVAILPGHAGPRPLALMSFHEVFMLSAGGERIDVTASYFLSQGWHPAAPLGPLGLHPIPPARPWLLRYRSPASTMRPGGELTLTQPGAVPIASWPALRPAQAWLEQIRDIGWCDVYLAPMDLGVDVDDCELDKLDQAIGDGIAVAARVSTEITFSSDQLALPRDQRRRRRS